MFKLICMTFDGDYVTEGEFDSVQDAWERSEDMGSRWYFYPFHFVVSQSGKSIVDAPEMLDRFKGKRIKTVRQEFKRLSEHPAMVEADANDFAIGLYSGVAA